MKFPRLLASFAACALVAGVPAGNAVAQHEHGTQHEAAGGAVAQLKLDGTARWTTDASLREGMASIRAAFDVDHAAIHADRQSDEAYSALAARIDQQVQTIIANCRLPAAADTNLHLVIADLLQGVSLMRGEDPVRSRHDGAAMVHHALDAYGRFFDDPTWQAVAPIHAE